MKQKTRIILVLISSLIICVFGTYRLVTETLSSTSLFVAYLFAIIGCISFVANAILLSKMSQTE